MATLIQCLDLKHMDQGMVFFYQGYVLVIALHLVKAVCVNAKMIKLNACLFFQ